MTDRIKEMREALYTKLKAKGTPGTWEHVITHIGMFTFSGLTGTMYVHVTPTHSLTHMITNDANVSTVEQVDFMCRKYHIYMLSNGRINICGLNSHNLDYVVDAIHDAVVTIKT